MATCNSTSDPLGATSPNNQQFAMLDMLIPGFSVFSSAIQAYLGIDLNLYIPLLLVACGTTWSWSYIYNYFRDIVEQYLMSTVRIRTDDEIFNMVMSWVAQQRFSRQSRRFIVNTNLNSRAWVLWRLFEEEDDDDMDGYRGPGAHKNNDKKLQYTPSYGTHIFWFRGQPLIFERLENREHAGGLMASETEEIHISCFGRRPSILKELLIEAREQHMAKDECKTLIYRGGGNGLEDAHWKRCMARSTRPFSTVILGEKVKQELIDDVSDYLSPATRRWYANRGIPYRRGYLLYGPPGTGKSSLSLAVAGFFNMRIYILSLSSPMATEENVASLFSSLPRRCVVLLEDIDSAGLTHTREDGTAEGDAPVTVPAPNKGKSSKSPVTLPGRLSLSGLLNILDGVASQEGRVLVMTTNHLEKLDKALIRPGRVDMTVEFGRADADMTASIFRAIYTPYDGEETPSMGIDKAGEKQEAEGGEDDRGKTLEKINHLSRQFATKIPEHEFSPAEIQGLLLRHKRDPLAVLDAAEGWIEQTRKEKAEKEVRDAEERRQAEEKRKKEEETTKKEEKRKAKKKASKGKKKTEEDDESGDDKAKESDLDTDSENESDKEEKDNEEKKKKKKKKPCSDSGYGTP